MKKLAVIVVCILFSMVSLIPTINSAEPVLATTLYVGGSGSGNYSTIQDAIDNATDGDTVFVYTGTYYERIISTKSIDLIGQNKDNTIIDGGGIGFVVSFIYVNWANLSGFTITNSGGHPNYAGIRLLTSNKIRIYDNNIMNNNGECIYLYHSNNNTVIFNNISSNEYGGSYIVESNHNKILNNVFIDNLYGFECMFYSNYNEIYNNIFSSNHCDGITIAGSKENNIINNLFINNDWGLNMGDTSSNNSIYHNNFINNNLNGLDFGENIWDNGYPSGGNYWDDYTGVDGDGDGIGDTPYNISYGNNQDLYPFINANGWGTLDVNQSIFDRGFPIRHAEDGSWAAAQNFTPIANTITSAEIYLRIMGASEFNLTVELREDHPQGPLLDTVSFTPDEVPSEWEWFTVDFDDVTVTSDTDYFIVIPSPELYLTPSFGYEWGYAFGNQYDEGAFWFTRDGGGLWRDLPTMYEFAFKTYGYNN